MKKYLLFTVAAATLLLSACNTKSKDKPMTDGMAFEEDSIYFVNDSTLADVQTFVFEGTTPMDGNAIADVILAVQTVNLNSDGTYTITTDYVDEGIATQSDDGSAMILLGVNDSTATIIELISNNYNTPTLTFMMMEDSSLVKVDSTGRPVAQHPNHKLNLVK
ncbi:MAG: copper resistance protein NlpE N-terminal domain-containing protein [Bacteroidaceae bacterium]|nr:copper resistance protein NlpE N-terminal domain-containing protein [Bacteroidaceae bacterium]